MKKMFLVLAMLVLSIVCNEQKGTFLEEKKENENNEGLLQSMNPFITGSTEDPKREPVLEVTIEEEETPR